MAHANVPGNGRTGLARKKMNSNAAADLSRSRSRLIEQVSPVTGKPLVPVPAEFVEDCPSIASRAAAAFSSWSAKAPAERAERLLAAAEFLERREAELCATMQLEIGATMAWARHNVEFAADLLRSIASYAAVLGEQIEISGSRHRSSRAVRVPCGVVLAITPWNAPLILGVRSVAAPLLCGNAVVLKGNEFAPNTFRMLGRVFMDAGLPRDVLQVAITHPEDSEAFVVAMVGSPVVRRVNFTGSTRVGRRVAEICAQSLKRPLLELGGQSCAVILEDADLERAADALVRGAYFNQGQICMSTERVIVDAKVADALVRLVDAGRARLKVGNPIEDESVDMGPVISTEAADRLSGLIGDATTKGAILVGGGGVRGTYFQPTLLDRVTPSMRIYREEAFGPVLSVIRVDGEDEAITAANDSEYGLVASVFTRDCKRGEKFASLVECGISHINSPTVDDDPHAPFGGVKSSGYGRFGGRWSLDEFTEIRWSTCALNA